MRDTAGLTDKLKTEMPQMLDEHKQIVAALDNLAKAAKSENKIAAVEFTEKLKMHAQNEEEILYPAAMLVGEYLKLRLKD
jgi:hemerythrin-like domain-containing protein